MDLIFLRACSYSGNRNYQGGKFMKPVRYSKLFLYAVVSILLLLTAPAMAQDASQASDLAESWDDQTAVKITFDGDTVDISGDGATLSNGVLILDKAGTYVLTGTWLNGQVRIDAGKEDTMRLILNGVSIHCQDNAPLYAPQAGKVIITLVKGTENTLSDGNTYTYTDGEAELDAALYVQDNLTINGRGSLFVTAGFKHGILSKDDLLIENGIISVTAADVGIRGRDSLEVSGGEITVDAKGDALQSNNGDDPEKGRITLTGGTFNLTSMKDGIQAETSLTISGGDYTLHTGGITTAQDSIKPEDWQINESSADAPGKGLKAGTNTSITGGTFILYCLDDAVNANGKITIQNGTFDIATRDDGLRANKAVEISGGELNFLTCKEGIDTADVLISGGTVKVNALNDGFKSAAGGDEESSSGENAQSSSVRLTGGDVIIKAVGDGIDSSGSVILEGGTLCISCSDGESSAVDCTDTFLVTGGTLAASGCTGMVKAPGSDSKQPSLMIAFSAPIKAGSKIDLTDDSGKAVLSCMPEQDFQDLLLSAPGLVLGKSCTLRVNGETVLTAELNDMVTPLTQNQDTAKD
jgi:hypothetical protein